MTHVSSRPRYAAWFFPSIGGAADSPGLPAKSDRICLAFSAAYDDSFVRLILGDAYVNLTLQNIADGEPLGIYAKMDELPMFFAITFNNIRVSFIAFTLGIIGSLGTGFLLFRNGIMLGSFQYFFYQKRL